MTNLIIIATMFFIVAVFQEDEAKTLVLLVAGVVMNVAAIIMCNLELGEDK